MPEFAPNPYLPDRGQQLAALLMSMGQGVTASDMAGRGVLPGLGMGASIFAASQAQAQQDAEKAWHWQQQQDMQKDYRKAQMGLAEERTAAMKRDAESKERMGGQLNALLGFGVPQSAPVMGPSPDLLKAGPAKVAYLQSQHGLSPVAAAGVVGNLFQESGFNPTITGDGGTAYGLGQWRGDRQQALNAFAQSQGKQASDPQVQLDFIAHEGKSGDMGAQRAWQMLQTAKTPDEATTALMHYFRPAGYTPANPNAGHGYAQRVQYAQTLLPGGAPAPASGAVSPPSAPSQNAIQQLDPALRASIAAVGQRDPEKAMQMLVTALQSQKKEDAWEPLTEQSAQMYLGKSHDPNKSYQRNRVSGKIEVLGERKKLDEYDLVSPEEAQRTMGPGYDPNKAYQRNKATGKLEVIGGSLVNINNQAESAFEKQISEQDAKRIGKIQENTTGVLETVNKVRQASEFLKETYTGPGADLANAWHRALGAVGVESARGKADAAAAAQAILAELTPKMRVEGSGATSDFEMKTFAAALPSLLNLPGGNEFVASLWEKVGNRAVAIQELAEKHAMQSKRLTGTTFTKEVKELGPLFSPEEMKRIKEAGKPAGDRKPLDQILQPNGFASHPNPNAPTNMPNRPPLDSILGR